MRLPNPTARVGDRVMILNYRRRPGLWEPGRVTEVRYTERYRRGFVLSYEVVLERRTPAGRFMHLTTASVRALPDEPEPKEER